MTTTSAKFSKMYASTLLVSIILAGVVFFLPKEVSAIAVESQHYTGIDHTPTASSIGLAFDAGDYPDFEITKIVLQIRAQSGTCPTRLDVEGISSDLVVITDTYENYEFNFSGDLPIFHEALSGITFYGDGDCTVASDFGIAGTNDDMSTVPYTRFSVGTGAGNRPVWIEVHDAQVDPISFKSPPFSQGMRAPDFENWWVCVALPQPPDPTGYYFEVEYGDTDTTDFTDSLFDNFGIIPVSLGSPSSANPECSLLQKSEDLVPGNYQAQAILYDQDDTFVFETEIFNFTIIAGEQTITPDPLGGGSDVAQACNAVSNTVARETCRVLRLLFIPSENTVDFTETTDHMATKVPFAYFYEIKDDIQAMESEEGETPSLVIDMSESALPIGGEEGIELFSQEKIEELAGSESVDTFRALMVAGIWVVFTIAVYHRAKGVLA